MEQQTNGERVLSIFPEFTVKFARDYEIIGCDMKIIDDVIITTKEWWNRQYYIN